MEIKHLFYINENKFVCQLVEKLCKQNNVACYTLDQSEDFTYLLDDLESNVVVVSSEGQAMLGEQLFTSLAKAKNRPFCILMSDQESDKFNYTMPKVLDPRTFIDDIKSVLGENNKKH